MTIIRDNSTFFKYPPELEKFRKLIWCPLDFPEPPEVDEAKLFEWIQLRHDRDIGSLSGSVSGATGPIALDDERLKRTASYSGKGMYPWRLIHAMRSDFEDNGWEFWPEFRDMLPELAEYIESLPVNEFYTISFLNQKPGVDVGLHTDPDIFFGLRFYLVNKSKAKIFFQKAKEPTDGRLLNIREETVIGGKDPEPLINTQVVNYEWNDICQPEKIVANNPTDRFAFHLTGTHAAHGVEMVPEDDDTSRVTAFMVCKVKPKEYAELLERSVEKYKDYAIWW
jgi:hypothetical protein